MSQLHVHVIDSREELAANAVRWNELWQRSEVSQPTARAEFILHWMSCFAPGARFQGIVVEDGNSWVAGLPLIAGRLARFVRTGNLPRNEWNGAGDLLLAGDADRDAALQQLAATLNQLGWPLYRFSHVRSESPAWRDFMYALRESQLQVDCRPSYEVSCIAIPSDWQSYQQNWSKDHRKKVRRLFDKLRKRGPVQLGLYRPATRQEAEPLLRRAFAIEDSGWKGESGTSLLKTPGLSAFVIGMAELLVPRRELELAFLELNGEPIAFEILWNSKRVWHSYKVGYDERFSSCSPGNLLIHELLREASETGRCELFDCIGPTNAGLRRWGDSTYQVSQITVAPRRWIGRALMYSYRSCRRADTRKQTSHTPEETSDDGQSADELLLKG